MKIKENVLIGFGPIVIPAYSPIIIFETHKFTYQMKMLRSGYSEEKRKIHYFVVRELLKMGEPMSLDYIAREMKIPIEKIKTYADELEWDHGFARIKIDSNTNGEKINWAYPYSVVKNQYHLTFSTGEHAYAS